MRPGAKGTFTSGTGLFRGYFDGSIAAENDEVSERNFLAVLLRAVEVLLDSFELREHPREFRRLVDFPVLLRRETNARAVGAAALVAAAESRGRSPGSADKLRNGEAGGEDLCLEAFSIPISDERMIDGGNGVLPDELFFRNERTEVACAGPHVTMGEFEPGAGKGVGKLGRVLHEVARDLFIDRIDAESDVRGQHEGIVALAGSCASGMVPAPALFFGFHWFAPAGLLVSSHS